jgi:hypothetical protein
MLYFGETNSSNFTQPLQSLAGPPQEIDSNRVDRPAWAFRRWVFRGSKTADDNLQDVGS